MDQHEMQACIDELSAPTAKVRLAALRALAPMGNFASGNDVNNHIHTTYSFSPYSPAKAAWMAKKAGLATAGIMDHDTISGAEEFIEAGRILRLPTTIGLECRADFSATPWANERLNNPDQRGIAYMALHGVPRPSIKAVKRYFEPVRQARLQRNRAMTKALNERIGDPNLQLDFEKDVVAMSQWMAGGQITERHLLHALARKLWAIEPQPSSLLAKLERMGMVVPEPAKKKLLDQTNPHRDYDLLGVLKSEWLSKIYQSAAADECPPLQDLIDFCRSQGIILAYAYLGDVSESVTGDKKAQTFEDAFLPQLLQTLQSHGVEAITYMPSRNSRRQLLRLRELCETQELFQISGEDINQPRQPFVCQTLRDPMFANLKESAWALIGHEMKSRANLDQGLMTWQARETWPQLQRRVQAYAQAARKFHAKKEEG